MSETFADLGGRGDPSARECIDARRHRFDQISGYCGACGRRDDGKVVPGTPAARQAVA